MAKFEVGVRQNNGVGAAITKQTAASFLEAQEDALDRPDVQAVGGVAADYTKEITGTEAEDGGFFTQTTGALLATSADNIDDKLPAAVALANGASESTTTTVGAALLLFNGSTRDKATCNQDLTVYTNISRTADPSYTTITNYNAKGCHLVIDCTAVTSTPSVVFTIEGRDVISGKYYTILASAAITGTGTTILRVYPGLTPSANLIASDILPRTIRIKAVHADSDAIEYSVGISLIL